MSAEKETNAASSVSGQKHLRNPHKFTHPFPFFFFFWMLIHPCLKCEQIEPALFLCIVSLFLLSALPRPADELNTRPAGAQWLPPRADLLKDHLETAEDWPGNYLQRRPKLRSPWTRYNSRALTSFPEPAFMKCQEIMQRAFLQVII